MANADCDVCKGEGWVCENHPGLPWDDVSGCKCGAGRPCVCNEAADLPGGFVVLADVNGSRLN